MKEYYLIPTSHIKDAVKDHVLNEKNNSDIPKTTILSLYDKIAKLERAPDPKHDIMKQNEIYNTSEQNILDGNESIQEKNNFVSPSISEFKNDSTIKPESVDTLQSEDDIISNAMTFVPKSFQVAAKDLIEKILKVNNAEINENGYIKLHSGNSGYLSDIVRAIFVKRAKVSHLVDLIKEIFPIIPKHYIQNIKVLELFDEDDMKLNVLKGGSNLFTKYPPTKLVKDVNKFHGYNCE